ncbi:hypothetical protein D3C71_1800530 [compost metagenome]
MGLAVCENARDITASRREIGLLEAINKLSHGFPVLHPPIGDIAGRLAERGEIGEFIKRDFGVGRPLVQAVPNGLKRADPLRHGQSAHAIR